MIGNQTEANQNACPERRELAEFLMGKCPDDRHEEIVAHADDCAACQESVSSLDKAARDNMDDSWISDLTERQRSGESGFEAEPAAQRAIEWIGKLSTTGRITEGRREHEQQSPETRSPETQSLGPYRIEQKLGEGGMGTVYKAWHDKLKRHVAIKVLRPDRFHEPDAVARFEREIGLLGRLDHPHIVRASHADEERGMHYLVMDFIDGRDLGQLVKRSGPLPVTAACELVRQAAEGLQYAHEQNMVHRDVKPSNFMLTSAGQLKILDLGLARPLNDEDGSLTHTGHVAGTPDYMAPEQWEDSHGVDIRADIYSLGCTLFYLLVGRPPFRDGSTASLAGTMRAHLDRPPPDAGELRADVNADLARIIRTAMAKSPDARFTTPGDMAQALQPFCGSAALDSFSALSATTEETAVIKNDRTLHRDLTQRTAEPADGGGRAGVLVGRRRLTVVALSCMLLAAGATWWHWQSGSSGQSVATDGNADSMPPAIGQPPDAAQPAIGQPADEKIRIDEFRVLHFRYDNRRQASHRFGDITDQVQQVRLEDEIRIEAKLNRPAWCYLFALHPDGTIEPCYPSPGTTPGVKSDTLTFPGSRDSYFRLENGRGQQAFVLAATADPLRAWPESVSDLPWTSTRQDGVWSFRAGSVAQLHGDERPRGVVIHSAEEFERFCKGLGRIGGSASITGLAFPVR